MRSSVEFLNNNIVATVIGAVVGGVIAMLAGEITYRRQRRDSKEREVRENFKHKAELNASAHLDLQGKNMKIMNIVFCSYLPSLNKNNHIDINYPKAIVTPKKLSQAIIYLENIGKSDINEFGVSVTDKKDHAMSNGKSAEVVAKNKNISYGAFFDEKIRPGEVIALSIYYDQSDKKANLSGTVFYIFFKDSLNNVCKQLLLLEDYKTYEPQLTNYKDWENSVNPDKILRLWSDVLKYEAKRK